MAHKLKALIYQHFFSVSSASMEVNRDTESKVEYAVIGRAIILLEKSRTIEGLISSTLINHNIDWDSAQCLTYSTNYFQRLTLQS